MTASAPSTARSGSGSSVRCRPAARTTAGSGCSVSGPEKTRSKSSARAACAQLLKTLLPSPTQVTRAPPDRPALFLECHDVGHDLAGVRGVRQPVDDGDGGGAGQLVQRFLPEGADHHGVDIAAEHAAGVGDRLAMAELHLLAREHHGLAAHLADADIERDARARRRLLEDQRDDAVLQRLGLVRAQPGPAVARRLDARRVVEDGAQIARRHPVEVEEMPGAHAALASSAAQAESSRRTASPISSSVQFSGGRRRMVFSPAGTVSMPSARAAPTASPTGTAS